MRITNTELHVGVNFLVPYNNYYKVVALGDGVSSVIVVPRIPRGKALGN
jgi:hypothetical protein